MKRLINFKSDDVTVRKLDQLRRHSPLPDTPSRSAVIRAAIDAMYDDLLSQSYTLRLANDGTVKLESVDED